MTVDKRAVRSLPTRKKGRDSIAETRRPLSGEQTLEALRALNAPGEKEDLMADEILGTSDVLAAQWEREFPAEAAIEAFTLTIRIRRLAMLVDEGLVALGQKAGVKLNELLLLLALRRVGAPYELRPTDILKMHSVTSGTVTYRIDQVINQGLAERIADPSDKRGYLIRLTSKGRRVVDQAIVESTRAASEFLRPLFALPLAQELFVEMLRFYERRIERYGAEQDANPSKTTAPAGKRQRAA